MRRIAMETEQKNRYFQELTLNLRHDGFAAEAETEEGHLPVFLDGQRLCLAMDTGRVRYWRIYLATAGARHWTE